MENNLGRNLKRLRAEKRLTLEELANKLNKQYGVNYNKGMISKWENGYSAQLSALQILSLFYEVTLNELLGFNVKKENKYPIFKNITPNGFMESGENIAGYAGPPPFIAIKDNFKQDFFYLRVNDNSMENVFPEGSLIFVRKNIPVYSGDYVVAYLDDEDKTIFSKIELEGSIIALTPSSYDSKYLTKIINTNERRVSIIGKVISGIKYC